MATQDRARHLLVRQRQQTQNRRASMLERSARELNQIAGEGSSVA